MRQPITLEDINIGEVLVFPIAPAPTGTSRFWAFWAGCAYHPRTGAPTPVVRFARLQASLAEYKAAATIDGLSVRIVH